MGCEMSTATSGTTVVVRVPTVAVHRNVVALNRNVVQFPQQLVQPLPIPERKQITKEIIIDYLERSRKIAVLESKNIASALLSVQNRLENLQKKLSALNERQKTLESNIDKSLDTDVLANEKIEITDSSTITEDSEKVKKVLNVTKAEKLQEVEQSIIDIKAKIEKVEEKNKQLLADNDKLLELHKVQDNLLEEIFGGVYGSTYEDQLEQSLDKLIKKQTHLQSVYSNWKYHEGAANFASLQLEQACILYQNAFQSGFDYKYVLDIVKIRNNLQAAFQNLKLIKYRLFPSGLPYFNNVKFNAFSRNDFRGVFPEPGGLYVPNSYHAYHNGFKSAQYLRNWMKHVADNEILGALRQVEAVAKNCRQDLRKERLRLMTQIAGESEDENVIRILEEVSDDELEDKSFDANQTIDEDDLDYADVNDAHEDDELLEIDKTKALLQEKASASEAEVAAAAAVVATESEEDPPMESPPAPSRNELFGDLDSIMAEHYERTKLFQQEQDSAKARGEAKLQERLMRRRSRKMREAERQEDN